MNSTSRTFPVIYIDWFICSQTTKYPIRLRTFVCQTPLSIEEGAEFDAKRHSDLMNSLHLEVALNRYYHSRLEIDSDRFLANPDIKIARSLSIWIVI